MTRWKLFFKSSQIKKRLTGFLLIAWLLTGCATSAPQTATPDVAVISTAAVATVYANLTLSPVSTPSPISTPLPPVITDEFGVPMVLVPAGPFLMGRGENNASPIYLEVTIGDYYIDKYEVTNASYRACVEAGVCEPPYHEGSYTHESYYLNPDFANYPVLSRPRPPETYCEWRGAHLVTEIEWEKAMRGTDGRKYPWGNDRLDGTRTNLCDSNCYQKDQWSMNDGFTDVAPVGSFPAGASPSGVMDLVGNVNEEVSESIELSEYREVTGRAREFVGDAYNTGPNDTYYAWFNIGFRCARDASEPVSVTVKLIGPTLTPSPTSPTSTPLPTSTPTPTATIRPEFLSAKIYPIAFVSEATDRSESLKLINSDGSGLRALFPLQQELSASWIPQPAWSPDGKTLYFIAQLSETSELRAYQVTPFETDPEKQVYRAIEGLPNLNYSELILSPDGRNLALIYNLYPGDEGYLGAGVQANKTLGLFNLQTRAWKTIPIPNFDPNANGVCLSPEGWSPNSREFTFTASVNATSAQNQNGFAFVSSRRGGGGVGADLFIANASGVVKKLIQISDGDLPYPCPVWIAGGKQIIFIGDNKSLGSYNELMAIRPDGSGAALLYTYELPQQYQLSPDRRHLALAANGELWHQAANSAGMFMDFKETDGMGRTYFGFLPWELIGEIGEDASLAWSPDNRRIAFQCDDKKSICTISADCQDEKGDCLNTGGSDLSNLTNGSLPGYGLTWSPDGLRIAYIAKSQGAFVLVVMNNDGSERRILVKDTALQMGLYRWSPRAVAP